MSLRDNLFRKKRIQKIKDGTIDWQKLARDLPPKYQEILEENITYIEEYARKNKLTEAQLTDLKELEVIIARSGYLDERNQQATRSGDEYAARDILNNNEEIIALNEQYDKEEAELGRHASAVSEYIEKRYNEKHQEKGQGR